VTVCIMATSVADTLCFMDGTGYWMAQGGTTLFEFWSNSEYTFNGGLNSFNHIMYATDQICQSNERLGLT
jgi:hypothetical protein